jgi:DNA polymerase-3 subunit gamma/tau
MSYIIFARKYRPMTFDQMIGQKHVVQTLMNAVKNDRVAQGYIFSGMRGVGKTTTARILAKALNCQHGPTPEPCNKCEFCLEINEDRSVDVLEIDGASNRGIEEVRALREGLKYKPIHSRYKVIIIDEVHMLTREAFNALLKTLEEPPPHTIFIFATTEFHKVPATIVSRCQYFEFKKISQKEIINHLLDITKQENITISAFGLNAIAEAADGSLRDAQSLLDQAVSFSGENISDEDLKEILGAISRETLFNFSGSILDEEPNRIFPLVEEVIEKGYDLRFFYKELIQHFRNLLLVKSVENPRELLALGADDIKALEKEAEKVSADDLLRYLVALQQGEQGLKFSSHPRIKLCHFHKIVPLQNIMQDIQNLRRDFKNPGDRDRLSDSSGPVSAAKAVEPPPHPLQQPELKEVSPKREAEASSKTYEETASRTDSQVQENGQKESDYVTKHPTVKYFLDTFDAQILAIEPIKKGKK